MREGAEITNDHEPGPHPSVCRERAAVIPVSDGHSDHKRKPFLRSQRLLRGLAPVLTTLGVFTVACGGSEATVRDQPTDLGSARDLAKVVATKAGCQSLEDFSLASADKWAFSCQFGTTGMFVIRTATSTQLRDAARPTGSPYKVGAYYLVTPDTSSADLEHLKAFPGQLVSN